MRLKRRVIDEATDPRLLPEMLIKTLDNLDGDALVLAPGEQQFLPPMELNVLEY